MLDMAVSPLSYVAVADSELLDTVVAAPRSFVAVVYMTMPALSAIKHSRGSFCAAPTAAPTLFPVAARMA